ncbi:MAG: DNA-3-methyladenine glycosylase [Candidatus Jorgensenbacteria bacterium]
MRKLLSDKFFERPALAVARELLGKYLVRRCPSTGASTERFGPELTAEGLSRMSSGRRRKYVVAMITEVEAYDGPHDGASHASRGLTKRNAPMFGPPGRWYVYFTYGMHWMLNVVTREKGYPAAVLIRSVQFMEVQPPYREVEPRCRCISGPGRVTRFFKIDKRFNGMRASRRTGLWIEDRGVRVSKRQIAKGERIGVEYAGPVWSKKKYRFVLSGK